MGTRRAPAPPQRSSSPSTAATRPLIEKHRGGSGGWPGKPSTLLGSGPLKVSMEAPLKAFIFVGYSQLWVWDDTNSLDSASILGTCNILLRTM